MGQFLYNLGAEKGFLIWIQNQDAVISKTLLQDINIISQVKDKLGENSCYIHTNKKPTV